MDTMLIAEPDGRLRTFVDGDFCRFRSPFGAARRRPRAATTAAPVAVRCSCRVADARCKGARIFRGSAAPERCARSSAEWAALRLSDDKYARTPQPHDKVFRFSDLGMLIAKIRESELRASSAVAAWKRH